MSKIAGFLDLIEKITKRRLGLVAKPTYINFSITKKCNSKCIGCNIWKVKDFSDEMHSEEIEKVFKNNKRMFSNVRMVQITGGEPFLKKNIEKIIFSIQKYMPKTWVWIASNGLSTGLILKKTENILKNFEKLGITLSVDGIGEKHDKIRGIKGNFNNTLETVKKLNKLKEKYPKLEISIGFTITKNNYEEIYQVYKLAKKHKVNFSFRPWQISDTYYENSDKNFRLNKKERKELEKLLEKIQKDYIKNKSFIDKLKDIFYMNGTLDYIKNPKKQQVKCNAGFLSFFLTQEGNIYPCIFMSKKLGNIRKDEFKKIWNNKKTKEVRKAISKGKCPNCWTECESQRDLQYMPIQLLIRGLKK